MSIDNDPLWWSVYSLHYDKWLLRAIDHPRTNMNYGLYMWDDEYKTAFPNIDHIIRFSLDMDIDLHCTIFVPVHPTHNGPYPLYEPDFEGAIPYHQDYMENQYG